jgi:hypothetical protein
MNRLRSLQTLSLLGLCLLCLDKTYAQQCPDPVPQTSGSHSFRQQGESFEIPISLADCQPVVFELRWANGRNNGSNFHVTFLDGDNQPIYTKEISAFLTGSFEFPFATLEPQPWLTAGGTLSVVSGATVPRAVTIQAVRPFAFPATISYRVTRMGGRHRSEEPGNPTAKHPQTGSGSKDMNRESVTAEGKAA